MKKILLGLLLFVTNISYSQEFRSNQVKRIVLNSDLVQSSNTYSITSGTNTLNVSDASFTILDVGKTISIYGAGVNGDDLELLS